MYPNKEALTTKRPNCPICESSKRSILISVKHDSKGFLDFIKNETFYSASFYDNYNNGSLKDFIYEVAECNNCHFIYLTEIFNDFGMGKLYNEWLDKDLLKEYYSKLEYNLYEETMLGLLRKFYQKKDKINLMDFGAGYGNFCAIATKLKFAVHAFDLSEDKNEHLDSMGATIINNLDKYDGFFDFIYVNQVFEHVANPKSILKKLSQCLTPGGLIYIAVPDCKDAQQILKTEGLSNNFFKLISPHQHINGFTNATLRLLGTESHLKPLSMVDFFKFYNTSLNFPEFKFLLKKTIKNSKYNTGLFFGKAKD